MTRRMRRLQYLRETGRPDDYPVGGAGLEERAAALVTNEQAEQKTESESAGMPGVQLDGIRSKKRDGA